MKKIIPTPIAIAGIYFPNFVSSQWLLSPYKHVIVHCVVCQRHCVACGVCACVSYAYSKGYSLFLSSGHIDLSGLPQVKFFISAGTWFVLGNDVVHLMVCCYGTLQSIYASDTIIVIIGGLRHTCEQSTL